MCTDHLHYFFLLLVDKTTFTMPTADTARKIPYSDTLQSSDHKREYPKPTGISPDQSDKQVCFGLEVVQQMVWRHWSPGKEYIKNIVLKNVVVGTQKVKFRYKYLYIYRCTMLIWVIRVFLLPCLSCDNLTPYQATPSLNVTE